MEIAKPFVLMIPKSCIFFKNLDVVWVKIDKTQKLIFIAYENEYIINTDQCLFLFKFSCNKFKFNHYPEIIFDSIFREFPEIKTKRRARIFINGMILKEIQYFCDFNLEKYILTEGENEYLVPILKNKKTEKYFKYKLCDTIKKKLIFFK